MSEKPEDKPAGLDQATFKPEHEEHVQTQEEERLRARLLRSNIGNAKLGGLENDLGLTKTEYQWALSIFYFGYVIFDLPSNIVMRRWRPSYWLALLMGSWGAVATAMAACHNFAGLAASRFLLGVFEAGKLFIIEGAPSIILSAFAAWYLPNSPETAKFLTDEEREYAVNRLAIDAGASNDHSWSWKQVASVFSDWKTYAFMAIYILGTSALQGVTLFLPSIIAGMGTWSKPVAQALTTPPYFMAFLATLAIGYSSDKFFERAYHMIGINVLAIAGFLMLMLIPHSNVPAHYAAACLVTVSVYANVAVKVAWFNNNFGGLTRRAVASAAIVSVGTCGGIIGGQMYYDPPLYFGGNAMALAFVAAQTILVVIVRILLARENKRRSALTQEEKSDEVFRYGGVELAGDRHPDYRYVL
ncbi:hypothetical protein EC973_007144 [Apophysomyces ossiformis]|uniref:Uncharacterized protein n=1 Tax=Apophysomyces ossiformis TaxID=679940 RepID=A0A8H7BVM2_9FUNG|nr:hypothetical protein EC973_007144 [Apophysomyces ossiformis]